MLADTSSVRVKLKQGLAYIPKCSVVLVIPWVPSTVWWTSLILMMLKQWSHSCLLGHVLSVMNTYVWHVSLLMVFMLKHMGWIRHDESWSLVATRIAYHYHYIECYGNCVTCREVMNGIAYY